MVSTQQGTGPDQPSRRTVLKAAGLTALAASAAGGAQAAAQSHGGAAVSSSAEVPTSGGRLITRAIPSTGERVPVVGLGTFMTFDRHLDRPRKDLRQVLHEFHAGGGRVLDTSPLYGLSEANVGEFASAIEIGNSLFLTNKTWATGEYLSDPSHAERQLRQSMHRLSRTRLDAVQVHSLTNVEMIMPMLVSWKRENRIRYLGVTHHDPAYYPIIERWIRTGDLDLVQVHYSIQCRDVERTLLPLTAEHGTAVMVNMPLEKARLHKIVEGRPLPALAVELGCANWAQFFLKYVISRPEVTCVLPATTKPAHLAENLGAMHGELPDERARRQMVRLMEKIPGFTGLQSMPWYPGKTFDGLVRLPET